LAAIVLVHALYHRPEHFALVAEPLRSAGTEVVVPELHKGSLSADTAAVQAVIDSLPEPSIVLGHSYGGSVITGLHGAGHLVYLAAFVPAVGESAATLGGTSSQLQDAINPEPDGSTSLYPDRAAGTLYGDCPEALAAWAVACCVRKPPAAGEASQSATAGSTRPPPTSSAHRTAPSPRVCSGRWPRAAPTCTNGRRATPRS
jgi:hypothetical protein